MVDDIYKTGMQLAETYTLRSSSTTPRNLQEYDVYLWCLHSPWWNTVCCWCRRWWIMQLPALDEGLLHPGGSLWGGGTCRVLAHHRQKLQQQFGALCFPSSALPAKKKTKQETKIVSRGHFFFLAFSWTGGELFFFFFLPLPLTWWGHTGCRVSSTGSGNTRSPQRRCEEAAPPSGVCCTEQRQQRHKGLRCVCTGWLLPGWIRCSSKTQRKVRRRKREVCQTKLFQSA